MVELKRKMKGIIATLMCFAMVAGALMIPVEAKAAPAPAMPQDGDEYYDPGGDYRELGTGSGKVEFGYTDISKKEATGAGWTQDLRVYWVNDDGTTYYPLGYYSSKKWGYITLGPGAIDLDGFKSQVVLKSKTQIDDYINNDGAAMYWLPDPSPTPSGDTKVSAPASAPAHTHSWTYGVISAPTEDSDGLEGETCSCGAQRNTSVIPAAFTVYENRYKEIEQARPGKDNILDMKEYHSLSQAFMKKLASKSDCSFTIRFTYEHKHYEIYIPAGTTFDTSLEWYGPKKLMEMFEWKQLD